VTLLTLNCTPVSSFRKVRPPVKHKCLQYLEKKLWIAEMVPPTRPNAGAGTLVMCSQYVGGLPRLGQLCVVRCGRAKKWLRN